MGEPNADVVFAEEHSHFMARLIGAAKGGTGVYDTTSFIKQWLPELEGADGISLLCRKHPPPVYEILCSVCSVLDRTSQQENGKLLCAWCRDACASCGCSVRLTPEKGVKRKLYCSQCWDDWYNSTVLSIAT